MCTRALMAGLAVSIVPSLVLAKAASPEVPLEKALTVPAPELSALCNRAAISREYVRMAQGGATVYIGRRRVTPSNADTMAAAIEAQLEVCRAAAASRGVPNLAGDWVGHATGCDRAGSLLAVSVNEAGTVVNFDQDGMALTMMLSGKTATGEDFEFPAPGRTVEHYIVVVDPMNSDYTLQGEVTDTSIVLRPDTKGILAAWPKWANPPGRADLDSCVVTFERRATDSLP
jgi:hypothetical protein